MRVYSAYVGDDIEEACRDLIRHATAFGQSTKMDFNDIILVAKPNDDPSKIVARYRKKRTRKDRQITQ